ncbi:hypothetical protein IscW_ISCW004818 [Ixodes scapularis]|uniref:Uncharacterized protein n=1 Tax=Ixodes scapularis TaxID=6945 RepID=B7PIR1_IXOSC|nr:hypothetical protein IscW_ISCW004818 [Ixodes scapularis]|eukprot:XP_002405871.1 hypothetical protein IscW_ISCW004818 [Ixodes scapularis]
MKQIAYPDLEDLRATEVFQVVSPESDHIKGTLVIVAADASSPLPQERRGRRRRKKGRPRRRVPLSSAAHAPRALRQPWPLPGPPWLAWPPPLPHSRGPPSAPGSQSKRRWRRMTRRVALCVLVDRQPTLQSGANPPNLQSPRPTTARHSCNSNKTFVSFQLHQGSCGCHTFVKM